LPGNLEASVVRPIQRQTDHHRLVRHPSLPELVDYLIL
jgi:hypothetical protein